MTCDLFTSLPEPAADSWPTASSVTPPSGPSNSIPIAVPSCAPEPQTVGSQDSKCMKSTSVTLIHASTPEAWISLQAAFLARTLARLAVARALPASDQDSGANSPASCGWYDPASHSLKTAQCSLFADSMSSSLTLPRSGSMRNGKLYPQPMRVRPIAGNASGFWRTPSAQEPGVSWDRLVPIAGGEPGGMNRHFDKHTGRMAQLGLMQQVKLRDMWQTPVADDAIARQKGKINSRGEPKRHGKPRPAVDMTLPDMVEANGGSLNPAWVEWLMGWPIGYTALKHWATAKSRSKRPSPGKS